jgi:hypothetical protein
MLRTIVYIIALSVVLYGCGAPKAVKLDGDDRTPVNKPDKINSQQVVKDGGVK